MCETVSKRSYDSLQRMFTEQRSQTLELLAEVGSLKGKLDAVYRGLHWFPEVEDAKDKCDIPRVFNHPSEYANHIREIAETASQHIAAIEELILVLRADDTIKLRVESLLHSLAIPARRSDKAYETGYALIKRRVLEDIAKQLEAYAKHLDLKMLTQHSDSLFFAEILKILRNN